MPYERRLCGKIDREGLVVKRPGFLSKDEISPTVFLVRLKVWGWEPLPSSNFKEAKRVALVQHTKAYRNKEGKVGAPNQTHIGKNVMSIKFLPVILGPETAAPILWAPGIFWFFLLENPHAHKIPPFGGGGCYS